MAAALSEHPAGGELLDVLPDEVVAAAITEADPGRTGWPGRPRRCGTATCDQAEDFGPIHLRAGIAVATRVNGGPCHRALPRPFRPAKDPGGKICAIAETTTCICEVQLRRAHLTISKDQMFTVSRLINDRHVVRPEKVIERLG